MSFQPVDGLATPVQPVAVEPSAQPVDECLEFVRFCYRRRHAAWPALYDEMCAVASRAAFRGLGYPELIEHGISFCLSDMPRLAAMTDRVIDEERVRDEISSVGPMKLSVLPAGS